MIDSGRQPDFSHSQGSGKSTRVGPTQVLSRDARPAQPRRAHLADLRVRGAADRSLPAPAAPSGQTPAHGMFLLASAAFEVGARQRLRSCGRRSPSFEVADRALASFVRGAAGAPELRIRSAATTKSLSSRRQALTGAPGVGIEDRCTNKSSCWISSSK